MLRWTVSVILSGTALLAQNHVVSVPCCSFVDSVSNSSVTTVAVGTTVEWQLSGVIGHTVTSGTGAAAPGAGSLFDFVMNPANPTFTFTFNTPGEFPYFCRPHENAGMTGTVIVTVPASTSTSGAGCVGSSGTPFALAANGLPTLGNAAFAFTFSGGPAGGQAFVYGAFGLSPVPVPLGPCFVHIDLTSALALITTGLSPIGPIALDGAGAGALSFPVGSAPSLNGFALDVQAVAIDAGVAGGVVLSNAFTLVMGI